MIGFGDGDDAFWLGILRDMEISLSFKSIFTLDKRVMIFL